MSKLYTTYDLLNISSITAHNVIVSTGFSKIYQNDDGSLYYKDDSQTERRISFDLRLGSGLTSSRRLENVIAPYGSVLYVNIGEGMSLYGGVLSVDKIRDTQILTTNSPSLGSVLTYNGTEMEWGNKITIDDMARMFNITCDPGYVPVGTYSYDGATYTLNIICSLA